MNLTGIARFDVDSSVISSLIDAVERADEARAEWVANQAKLTQQRFGVRRSARTVPWPGASDLRIPVQDKAIRRWKAKILTLVYDVSPVAYFRAMEPGDVESARLVEWFYDWLFRIRMEESVEELSYLADLIAHRGFGIVQVYWDYRTEDEVRVLDVEKLFPGGVESLSDEEIAQVVAREYETDGALPARVLEAIRAGEPRVPLEFSTVVADRPRIVARDPLFVIVPENTTDIGSAEWVCVQHFLSASQLRALARNRGFEPSAVEAVLDASGSSDRAAAERSVLDTMEGVTTTQAAADSVELWEVYAWKDDEERRRVVYWIHPASQTLLVAYDYVYPFHHWPFVKFDHEKTFRRWHASRGLSKMLAPFATYVNRLHNARLDAIQLELAPAYKVRGGAAARVLEFGPGRLIPVGDLDDIAPLIHDLRNLGEYTKEEYQVRQYAEDYAGIYDSSLMNALSPTERRTATEVAYVADQMQGSFSLDAKLFQTSMALVHRMVWQLWYEFGEEQVFFRVMNEEQPRLFSKAEVARNYDIVPAGTIANTSKALELARAREALQFFANDQSGIIDRAELFRWYLGLLDWALARRIIRSSEEQQARAILLQAASDVARGGLADILRQAQVAAAAATEGNVAPGGMPV